MDGCTAVSYTHLDVYKRQEEGRAHRVILDQQQMRRRGGEWIHRNGLLGLYAAQMSAPMLTRCVSLLPLLPALLLLAAPAASARVVQLRVAKLSTAVATLQQVRVQLHWQDQAEQGELQVWAGKVDAPCLLYTSRCV